MQGRAGKRARTSGDEQFQYDSDTEPLFRQDSWFQYLFGVKEPGMLGAIDIASGKCCLFIPKLSAEYEIWCGKIHSPDSFKASYAVDEVAFTDDVSSWLNARLGNGSRFFGAKLHLMDGVNSDSGMRAVLNALTS